MIVVNGLHCHWHQQGSGRVFHEGEMGLTLKEAKITNGQEVHISQAADGDVPQVCILGFHIAFAMTLPGWVPCSRCNRG
jgi:hypothetical protein